ncbi:hypothetical protein [Botrimarina sp.]|uniref:hypothetical protein n=1 Tax=Botrimarina sp. TaxID=2795802 RepID=UPI0032EDD73E
MKGATKRESGARRPVRAVLLAITAVGASAAAARAQGISLVIDTSRGAAFLKNTAPSVEPIDAYQITSPDGALLPALWASIADNYDADDDQSVDAMAPWFEIAGLPISLAEASTSTGSAGLSPGQVVSLGLIYDLSVGGSVGISIADGVVTSPGSIFFLDLAADYDGDLDVDAQDYAVYAATYGSTLDLRADGNLDGRVDAADYTLWRDSPLLDAAPPWALAAGGTASLGAIAAPEPSGAAAACVGVLGAALRRRPPVRACRRAAW